MDAWKTTDIQPSQSNSVKIRMVVEMMMTVMMMIMMQYADC